MERHVAPPAIHRSVRRSTLKSYSRCPFSSRLRSPHFRASLECTRREPYATAVRLALRYGARFGFAGCFGWQSTPDDGVRTQIRAVGPHDCATFSAQASELIAVFADAGEYRTG